MKKYGIFLYITILALQALACQIVMVDGNFSASKPAKEQPTLADALPTPTLAPACLLVHALPGGEGSLNLRAGAGTSYAVLAVLHDGQTLVMDGQSGDWFAVTLVMDGRTIAGYVHSDYVEACQ